MERRGQERDIGLNPESESPVKLPLAAIVSTPADRRGNATAPTRRGSAIFSPTQTLDHRQRLKDPSPDPDPSTPTAEGPSNSRTPPSPPNNCVIRYRECLKNHAASMGGHVVDGCGEFMPNGEQGTAEGLRCAACDCHRNFHRKEVDGEAQPSNLYQFRTPVVNTQTPQAAGGFGAAAPAIMSFGDESSSEDLNMGGGGGHAAGSKKRFRTKFSQEQKDRMQELAEKLGWRIQKQDEQQVQQLCQETGVKRQVFKVWMHNNKQAIKKRQI
ncbi:zinc-finger homeodomain protein 2-like [Salvia miltiorrhiza]|uniref:zinc-finger homeodomain protein 2-like n=1 Tax=Salvia miltiorrhiza TaxID=226208 RepID=UPI0025ACB827|nr:zinc-finger homeodomain protein 2-like [Salvia miltiorrhiza]XP_057785913.1 zinc-finger homeodomain protein 2-like [Salvia miltiorrhiza]XP_057785914.1 zinc-finger homeodomain protein 2-like [Salvia miltiorrhiza]XP_057785915.1 zinc-finger homeodomain protein 2-like [Salvia miltiorrhiza]XP_057785916.1 zinc-finger homeodomain protein 2-like [Salvia miltiorrhiza]XP_057809498.1 zinc-finger homeodomain protein 2-like [Salvia miltiorrhiza]XP_057809499.1 zinc-finger homeodomain protein 2-like [Salv